MKINRLALFAALVHRAEGENTLSIGTPESLTYFNTAMGVPGPSWKKQSYRYFLPNCEVSLLSRFSFLDQSCAVERGL